MNNMERTIDRTLDQYVATRRKRSGGLDPNGFRAVTLAGVAKVTREEMSTALQGYRILQGVKPTRYVIGCQGYGRASRWRILALPGSDPRTVQRARAEQMRWATDDAVYRHTRDMIREVAPALKGTALDNAIRDILPLVSDQFAAIVKHVARVTKT